MSRGNLNRTAQKFMQRSREVRPSTKQRKDAQRVFGQGNPNTSKTQPKK